jgi:hypothetical protein
VANKRTKRPTVHSFLDLEAQLNELSGKSYLNEEATPRQLTSNFAPNFTTFLDRPTVTVTDPNIDNVSIYDSVKFVTQVSVGGLILGGSYLITTALRGASYEINALSKATASVSNGGVVVPVFTTTGGDSLVEVMIDNHGALVGDTFIPVRKLAITGNGVTFVPEEGVAIVGNGVTISGSYEVATVVDDNNFTIQAVTQATASGPFSMNGGDVQLVYSVRRSRIDPAEGIIRQIAEICSQLPFGPVFFGAESRPYAEWFCEKLRSRWRSSGDCLDYSIERTRLLTHLAEISTKKQRQILKERGRQRHEKAADRNIKLAEEFRRKYKPGSPPSASALKANIGVKEHLTRSAAIAAVDDGLRRLRKR